MYRSGLNLFASRVGVEWSSRQRCLCSTKVSELATYRSTCHCIPKLLLMLLPKINRSSIYFVLNCKIFEKSVKFIDNNKNIWIRVYFYRGVGTLYLKLESLSKYCLCLCSQALTHSSFNLHKGVIAAYLCKWSCFGFFFFFSQYIFMVAIHFVINYYTTRSHNQLIYRQINCILYRRIDCIIREYIVFHKQG